MCLEEPKQFREGGYTSWVLFTYLPEPAAFSLVFITISQ